MFKTKTFSAAAICAVALAWLASPALPQQHANFDRARTIDVLHYTIRTRFDRKAKKVIGDTTVKLAPLSGTLSAVELDSAGLAYDSVSDESTGKALAYTTNRSSVSVELGRAIAPGEPISLRFRYAAKPAKGVYFIDELVENGAFVRSAQIWTQGEPDEAHHWFPSFDFPSDKATSEQFITADADESVIANGELVGTTSDANGSVTTHYRMLQPHPTYLISFVIGKYVRLASSFGDIPLGYYVYPGLESTGHKAFSKTPEILAVYENVTGIRYPFAKYDQTIVAGFSFGGMENITATTLSDKDVFLVNSDLTKATVEDLVSHEAAHSWFGNLVTCRNWAELWLNEGFATFMEAVYREKAYGRDSYMRKIRTDAALFLTDAAVNSKRASLYDLNAGDVAKLFDRPAIQYNKGGAVVHMLREEVGDEAFWQAVTAYLRKHKFGSVTTPDLQAAMEEASGRKLDWFFNQWVYGSGYPKLIVKRKFDQETKTLRLSLRQDQKAAKLSPKVFTLPMEVAVATASGSKVTRIAITKREETFSIPVDSEPKSVTLDPAEKIIIKSVKDNT